MVKKFVSIAIPCLLLWGLVPGEAAAQDSYKTVFPFLNLTTAARPSALGGNQVALFEGQSDMMHINPAYIEPEDHKSISLSYINHLSDINFGFLTTSYHLQGIGTVGTGCPSESCWAKAAVAENKTSREEISNTKALFFSNSKFKNITS